MDDDKKTLLVFSDDLDKGLASFILANGAAAMGNEVTMFFAFWGVNLLRSPSSTGSGPGLMGRAIARGPAHLRLSKWNFGGLGPLMIRRFMRKANVMPLPELISTAQEQEVRMVVCTMSLDLFGLSETDLIDGLEFGGVATYFEYADEANVNLML
jgi:peroxiredoxin family protein